LAGVPGTPSWLLTGNGGRGGSGAGGPGGPTICVAYAGAPPAQAGVTCTLGPSGVGGTGGRKLALGAASNGPTGLRLEARPPD